MIHSYLPVKVVVGNFIPPALLTGDSTESIKLSCDWLLLNLRLLLDATYFLRLSVLDMPYLELKTDCWLVEM